MTETSIGFGHSNLVLSLEITNTKIQIPNKSQIRKNNDRNAYWFWSLLFGASNLFVIWCLRFGIYLEFGA